MFRLELGENIATIWLDISKDQMDVVIQGFFDSFLFLIENTTGNSPNTFWNEIQAILNSTAKCFKGIDFDYCYMCPQCLLKIEGKQKIFPSSISKDSIYLQCFSSSKYCSNGHELQPIWLTEGYITGNSSTHLKKRFQGKNIAKFI